MTRTAKAAKAAAWPGAWALVAWVLTAGPVAAQDTPALDAASLAPLAMDPGTASLLALLDVALRNGGAPLVVGVVCWKAAGLLASWQPTVRVIHHQEQPAPWDGKERRRGER